MNDTPPAIARSERLRITEIYASVQGESTHVGKPCVFVRLTGCNLRCTWCDSAFTFQGGTWASIDEIVERSASFGIHTVEVTGGEPLLQPNAVVLMQRLVEAGHEVLLETSGSRDISVVPPEVRIILDLKPPDSGEVEANLWSNVDRLAQKDEVKFVLASRRDYEWARDAIREHRLHERCGAVLLSPAWGLVDPRDVVEWMLADRVPARLQLQLHKVVWPADARGV